MAFRVSTKTHNGQTLCQLHDETSGASASILASYGFNLFDLRLPVAGQVRPVIAAADDFATNPRGAGGNGIPILFPYPNRVRDGRFRFENRAYELPVNLGPNAIHGFAIDVPWDVIELKAPSTAATVTGQFQLSRNAPAMRDHWPTDAILQVRYSLAGRRLTMTTTVTNPTAQSLPYGFGIHPYFRLPIAPGGDLSRARVVLPASRYWVLDQFLPTGERRPVDARLDFRKGQPMKGLKLDDVLTGLAFEGDRCVCRLMDLDLRSEVRLSFDRTFRELVVYTPGGAGNVISLEPYTHATDAVNLQARGVDAGLRVLRHDEHQTMQIVVETAESTPA